MDHTLEVLKDMLNELNKKDLDKVRLLIEEAENKMFQKEKKGRKKDGRTNN